MFFSKPLLSSLSLASLAAAQFQGFNYGATNADGSCRTKEDFVQFFNDAKYLTGTNNAFQAARLYTSIQCGTDGDWIGAFDAAVETNTQLLLGIWASAGSATVGKELNAILGAEAKYGTKFTDLILGISVGSEDLYRSSAEGVKNNAGVGATAAEIAGYIGWLRDWFAPRENLKWKWVGHVDTWTAWELEDTKQILPMVDFIGHNAFPYFESGKDNTIDNAPEIFWESLRHTQAVAATVNKPVWVTETGWPNRGPDSGKAVASVANAQKYWKNVKCALAGQTNFFWYTLKDANTAQTEMSFAVTPNGFAQTPYFDLTC